MFSFGSSSVSVGVSARQNHRSRRSRPDPATVVAIDLRNRHHADHDLVHALGRNLRHRPTARATVRGRNRHGGTPDDKCPRN